MEVLLEIFKMKNFIFYKENPPYDDKIHVFPISALKDKNKLIGFIIYANGTKGIFSWSIDEIEMFKQTKISFKEACKIVKKEYIFKYLNLLSIEKSKWKNIWKGD